MIESIILVDQRAWIKECGKGIKHRRWFGLFELKKHNDKLYWSDIEWGSIDEDKSIIPQILKRLCYICKKQEREINNLPFLLMTANQNTLFINSHIMLEYEEEEFKNAHRLSECLHSYRNS